MKVVAISNYADDTIREQLVMENLTQEQAQRIADERNKATGEGSIYWYVVKPDDYILWRGMADLVGDE